MKTLFALAEIVGAALVPVPVMALCLAGTVSGIIRIAEALGIKVSR